MAEWKNILPDNNEQLSNEDLLKYLDSNTSEEEKYAIEKKFSDTSFESDAIDGLQQIKNQERLKNHVSQLNLKLQQQLISKKHRKEKRKIKNFQWIILTIVILLLLCLISLAIISMHNKNRSAYNHIIHNAEYLNVHFVAAVRSSLSTTLSTNTL